MTYGEKYGMGNHGMYDKQLNRLYTKKQYYLVMLYIHTAIVNIINTY